MKSRILFILCTVFMLTLLIQPAISYAQNSLTPEQRAKLEAELAQVETEQKQAEKDLASAQSQSSSITKDIAVLTAKIKVAQLNIKAKSLSVASLGKDIQGKVAHIGTLEQRIQKNRNTLAVILRKTNEYGDYSVPEVILSQSDLTGFFSDLDAFEAVQSGLKVTFEKIRSDKSETEAEKSTLDKRRNAELDAKYVIEQEEKAIKANEAEKKRLLVISKGNESVYQADLVKKRARAAQIRATLFPLKGADPIPFSTAYAYALEAEKRTGIRPAFLLGTFAQESSNEDATFGKQIGSCYLADVTTGNGKGANTGSQQLRVMNPNRDVQPFLQITKELGSDPYLTRVSCWQPVYDKTGAAIGWGGAMGAAQFIPSTWILYVNRLKAALNTSTMPDPWNNSHAFTASSMLLVDNGAAAQTYTAERNAACKYFSGKACPASGWIANYGTSVMNNAARIQRTMIDPLQGL